jgi:hypothetical protein
VNDDLVPLAGSAWIEPLVQRGLREQGERVGLLLWERRRVFAGPDLLVQRVAGGGQRSAISSPRWSSSE